jgi:hypothetical protein
MLHQLWLFPRRMPLLGGTSVAEIFQLYPCISMVQDEEILEGNFVLLRDGAPLA